MSCFFLTKGFVFCGCRTTARVLLSPRCFLCDCFKFHSHKKLNVSPRCPSPYSTQLELLKWQCIITWVWAVTRCSWISCMGSGFLRATKNVPQVSLSVFNTLNSQNSNVSLHGYGQSQGTAGFHARKGVFSGLQSVSLRCPFRAKVDLEGWKPYIMSM